MHTVIVSEGLSHLDLFAQAQVNLGNSVGLYTTTPKFKVRGFPQSYTYHFVPGPVQIMRGLLMNRLAIPRFMYDWDCSAFDKLTARFVEKSDLLLGAASSSLLTGLAAKRNGGKYVLDRACPDIRVQERTMTEESKKARGSFVRAPDWFLDRQVQEYEEADYILVPSNYSRQSFPEHLKRKIILVRLTGSVKMLPVVEPRPDRPFTVGVVGGDPLRKGYMYLLQAWKALGWTDARLLMRTSPKVVGAYPVIEDLLASQSTVSFVDYVPDIADFYRQCDAFILPSIDDGFGMAFFEALANGVPSIATSNCGASELLTPEEQFLLIEPFNVQAIKDALQRLRDSPDLRAKLAESGLRAVHTLQDSSRRGEYQKGVDELMNLAFLSQNTTGISDA